jgi:hypothetical protein
MAPPPNSGDATNKNDDDPLGGMDPMAWLESLAARQGANPEELITAANLDIPVPPADTVIDEPGYTPGYDTGKAAKAEAPKEVPVAPEPVQAVEPPQAEPVAAAATDDPLGGMDPMAWLESLAARQGANPEELITAANLDIPMPPADAVIDEPGYVDYDPFGSGVSRGAEAPRTPEPAASPTPEPAAAGMDDLLGGMDPLAWLESLTASATPEDAGSTVESTPTESVEVSATAPSEPEAASMPAMSLEEATQLLGIEPAPGADVTDDLLGGMDPLAWLESLAARQGANPEELVTGGKLNVPETPPVESAAGTAEYSPFATTPETPGGAMAPESALSWLEELAKEQTGPMQTLPAEAGAPSEAGGASKDIAEVQAWLFEQARNLEMTREALEAEEAQSGELPPAEPAELPDWLAGSISQAPPAASTTPALSDEIAAPVAPSDLPSWLAQPEPDASLEELLGALQGTSAAPEAPPVQEPAPSPIATSELEALVRPASPEEVDSWAEALDEEYERRLAGDESVPEWYREALARAEAEIEVEPSEPAAEAVSAAEMFGVPAAAEEAPAINWLEETSEPTALPGEVPDWLRGMAQPVEQAPAPVPSPAASTDWLPTVAPDDLADLPDWLKPAAQAQTAPEPVQAAPVPEPAEPPEPAPTPAPVQAAPAPQPMPQPTPQPAPQPVPQPVARPAAASPTIDHPARLKQARELVTTNQYAASLEHYQVLIDSGQLLEETRGDLRDLVEKNPADPKLRRLLGDTHMRLGDLQAALDAYRSALDQL